MLSARDKVEDDVAKLYLEKLYVWTQQHSKCDTSD